MRKNILLYVITFVPLLVVFVFFNRAYKELSTYSDLTNRQIIVYNSFQNLSRQINNAVILDPDLAKASKDMKAGGLFFTDSITVIRHLNFLKSVVSDSVNVAIAAQLDKITRLELSWLLNSNLPDSIINHRSAQHIAAFQTIDSLIDHGMKRTGFLIDYRKKQLNEDISKLRMWMSLFIVLAGMLLIYTSTNLFIQRSRRKGKENELENIWSRISDAVVSVDSGWRYTFLNDAALSTHPYSREETLGKVIWDVHPEMKGTLFWDKYHEAMLTKKVVEIESYYAPMDTWFTVKVYPSANGLTIFYKDVTETKKAGEAILRAEANYREIFDKANDAIYIHDAETGRVIQVNQRATEITGFSKEELMTGDPNNFMTGHPDYSFEKAIGYIQKAAAGKPQFFEWLGRCKDGSSSWFEMNLKRTNIGGHDRILAFQRDINDRKKVEEKLIKSEKIYRTIAASIPGSVICLLDTDFRYFLIEGDMLEKLGYSKDKLLGNKLQDVLPPATYASIKEEFKRVLAGETVTRESTSSGYDIISRFIPLKDENNIVYAIMTVAIDITQLKNAQRDITELNHSLEEKIIKRTEQLRQTNKELEDFSYSVSHDLRAPLRIIDGFGQILIEDYAGKLDEEGQHTIEVIMSNAKKMGHLIDDLLNFSKTGRSELRMSLVNMNELVLEVVHELKASGIAIPVQLKQDKLSTAKGDSKLLRQVWANLISNAIKYSGKKKEPVIEIGMAEKEGIAVYYVKDNGAGFDMKYADKLFGVFQRLHGEDEFTGTGVGLALSQRIIVRHGGTIWAEAEENEGATFYFTLPQ